VPIQFNNIHQENLLSTKLSYMYIRLRLNILRLKNGVFIVIDFVYFLLLIIYHFRHFCIKKIYLVAIVYNLMIFLLQCSHLNKINEAINILC